MLWLTKRTVRPLRLTWPIFPRHFCWNWASPTASTSSTTRISGSRCDATANASRVYIPLEYRLTGVSRNSPISANSTIWSNFRCTSRWDMPRMEPLRKMFSRPVSSGWKPVPTSSRLPTRPRSRTSPAVGRVIRLRTFSRVDFPAPLWPTTPSTSPGSTWNETSFSAQNSPGPPASG